MEKVLVGGSYVIGCTVEDQQHVNSLLVDTVADAGEVTLAVRVVAVRTTRIETTRRRSTGVSCFSL